MTTDGADKTAIPPHSPIQSTCRWPCIRTIRSANGSSRRRNQFPLISAVPMRSESAFAGIVLDHVVVECQDPAGARISLDSDLDPAKLIGRDHSERVGEREVRVGIRVREDDLGEQAAGQREHRAVFGARGIALDVAPPRIDHAAHSSLGSGEHNERCRGIRARLQRCRRAAPARTCIRGQTDVPAQACRYIGIPSAGIVCGPRVCRLCPDTAGNSGCGLVLSPMSS